MDNEQLIIDAELFYYEVLKGIIRSVKLLISVSLIDTIVNNFAPGKARIEIRSLYKE